MEFVCKPNMALHLNREIRPNVVLERIICAFSFLDSKGREKRARVEIRPRFWWEIFPFMVPSDQEEEGTHGVEESRDSMVRN